jgi:hypothetical protein
MRHTGLQIMGQDRTGLLRLGPRTDVVPARAQRWIVLVVLVAAAGAIGAALGGVAALLRILAPSVPPAPAWLSHATRQPGVVVLGCVLGAVGLGLCLALGRMQYRQVTERAREAVVEHTYLDEEDDEGEGYPYDYSLFD